MNCQYIELYSCINLNLKIIFKFQQLIILWTIVISTMFARALQCAVVWSFTCLSHSSSPQIVLNMCRCLFFLFEEFYSLLAPVMVTEGSQLIVYSCNGVEWRYLSILIIFVCLHLVMTLWQCDSVHRAATNDSHTVRAADSDQTGRPAPTAGDCEWQAEQSARTYGIVSWTLFQRPWSCHLYQPPAKQKK